jgi:L-ascorbate metabolism protein UlaG (beta-lactamase superfamily)
MKPDYITYSHKVKDHSDFQKLYARHQVNKVLTPQKQELENQINELIHKFEKENNGIIVDFEKSNIIRSYPSKERMNLSLFIDLDILLCDGGL